MLRFFTALVLSLVIATPTQAEPKSSIYGYGEKLVFASETTFQGDNGPRSLCTLVRDWHIFFIPAHREVKGYVLADANCAGTVISDVPASSIDLLVSSGMITQNVPANPTLTVGWMLWNYASLILSGLVILFVVLKMARQKADVDVDIEPPTTAKQTPMFDETLLTTMFHTARLNGDISQTTLQALIKSYKMLTGTTVTPAMITAKYALKTDTVDLLSIMHQFAGLERDTMMKACVDVAAADGMIQKPEHDFLMALGSALGLDGDLFRNQIRAAMRPTQPKTLRGSLSPA